MIHRQFTSAILFCLLVATLEVQAQETSEPFKQLELLHDALKKGGVDSVLVPVQGGGHGNFRTDEVAERLRQFFDKHLRGKDVVISIEPIKQGGNRAG